MTAAVCLTPLGAAQASLLVTSYQDGLQATEAQFQSGSFDLIQNNVYQRQDYSRVVTQIVLQIGLQNLPVNGERWGARVFEVTTNELGGEIFWVYDGPSDCFRDIDGDAVACGIKNIPFFDINSPDYNPDYVRRYRFGAYFFVQCTPRVSSFTGLDLEYKTVGFHDATELGTYTYKPTEYVPSVYAISYSRGILRPTLPGATAEKTDVRVLVSDNLGCLIAVRDVKTTLTNTVTPQTGGHTHFTNPNEPGTGKYTAQTAWGGTVKDLVPDKKVAIEDGLTDMYGLFQAGYTAGDLSVEETITIETRNREDISGEVAQAANNLVIRLPGLVPLPIQGPGYFVVKSDHHDFHHVYAKREVRDKLAGLPAAFAAEVKKSLGSKAPAVLPNLAFTGMSLVGGGLFDYRATRKQPHRSHRTGIDADLDHDFSVADKTLWQYLARAIRKRQGFVMDITEERPEYESATHWHLRYLEQGE